MEKLYRLRNAKAFKNNNIENTIGLASSWRGGQIIAMESIALVHILMDKLIKNKLW